MSRVAGVLLALIFTLPASGLTWYVDKDSTHPAPDGRSWARAFTRIQDGIDAAALTGGGEVWVAEGTYNETRISYPHVAGQNTGSLILRSGVAVYGGFAGNETSRDARNYTARVTTIDGSVARGGSQAYHVVVGANNAILDGFRIIGGNANGGAGSSDARQYGGGIFSAGVSPTVVNCTFAGNKATTAGGAMYNYQVSGTIENCTFINNEVSSTAGSGGAVFQYGSSPTFRNCSFSNGKARFGGAVYLDNCSATFRACLITDNTASWDGGAVYLSNGSSPTFNACVISRNKADNGAGVYGISGATSFVNCIFQSNAAGQKGGALYFLRSGSLMNCTLSGNTAATGRAVYSANDGRPTIVNSILWGNTGQIVGGQPNVRYSNIQGGFVGTGNINANPSFIGIGTSSLRLKPGSPCIDKGTPDNAPNADISGLSRPQGNGVDMGAYEGASCVLTTKIMGSGSGTVTPAPGTYTYYVKDTVAAIKATPATGSRFDRWAGDASGTQTSLSLKMDRNREVEAWFVRQYSLTTQVEGNGTVNPAAGSHVYDTGAVVNVTATPAAGWIFDHWTGDASGSANPLRITVNANKSVKAVFVRARTLVTGISGNGTIDPAPGSHTYRDGETVTVRATPADGWRFTGWIGDAAGTANPVDIVMTDDKSITALFERIPVYTLTVQVEGQGTVVPAPGNHEFVENTVVEVSATPDPDWRFSHWEGALAGDQSPAQITMSGHRTVKAVFSLLPLTVGDPDPWLGLVIGGTRFSVDVEGWNDACRLYIGDVLCPKVTAQPGPAVGLTRLTGVVPPMPKGEYPIRVTKTTTGQEASSSLKFILSDDPFRTDYAENYDAGVFIDDGNSAVTTYAVRTAALPGKALVPLRYESPEGPIVEIPSEAFPPSAGAAFLIVRTVASMKAALPGATLPDGIYPQSPVIDLHLLIPNPEQDGAPAVEPLQPLPAPVRLTMPLRAKADPEAYVGALATSLDDVMAIRMPDPADVIDTGAQYSLDDRNRALLDVDVMGAFLLAGQGLPGDVNGDGINDSVDVQAVVNSVLGNPPAGVDPDANGDGKVDAVDVQFVVNTILGTLKK